MNEIFGLIGNSEKIIYRAKELFSKGQTQLALEVLDILIQAKPDNIEARKLRMKLFKNIGENDMGHSPGVIAGKKRILSS